MGRPPEDVERYEDDVQQAVRECQKWCTIERRWERATRERQCGAGPQEGAACAPVQCSAEMGAYVLEGPSIWIWQRRETRSGEEGRVRLSLTALWRRSEYNIAAVLFFFLRTTRLEAN